MKATRELVLKKVTQTFPQHDPAEVLAILDRYGIEKHEGAVEDVHLSVLFASEGDLNVLRRLVETAKVDYRDVLDFKPEWKQRYLAWLQD